MELWEREILEMEGLEARDDLVEQLKDRIAKLEKLLSEIAADSQVKPTGWLPAIEAALSEK